MKMKMFKLAVMLMSVCIMFDVCASPVSAVTSNRTPTMYVYGEESYGTVILYPDHGEASTYCEWGINNKQVYIGHYYKDRYLTGHFKEFRDYWGTYVNYSGSTLSAQTASQNDVYYNIYAVSMHRVKVGSVEWTYEDDETGEPYLYA